VLDAVSGPPGAARRTTAAALLVALLALAWSWPISLRMIDDGDYPTHLRVAESLAEQPSLPAPHFLFFGAVAGVMAVPPGLSSRSAGLIVVSLLHVGTALFIAWYLTRGWRSTPQRVAAASVALLVVGPILPWSFEPDQYLVGYFAPNPYHNATFTTAKPFCLWLVIVAAAALAGSRRHLIAAALAAVALTAVSKPNYLTCLVPALVVAAAWRLVTRRDVAWGGVIAIVLPATAAVLLMQIVYGEREMSVVVAPFAALSYFVAIGPGLVLQLLGALAFPLAVIVLWPRLLARPELGLAWGATVVAFAEAYLLGESGQRMNHGNLLVAASQAVFVLMVVSAAAFASLPAPDRTSERVRRAIAAALFVLHLVGGARHVGAKMNVRDWWHLPTLVLLVGCAIMLALLLWPRRPPLVAASPQARA
jgi:hypothetical protein